MKIKIIYLLVFLFVEVGYTQEKEIKLSNERIEAFNSTKGFYQNTVNAITSDSKGYLWITTPNGLVQYDGYAFDYYYHENKNQESLPNSYTSDILSDSMGRLWIVTNEGLSVYLTGKELFVPIENEIKRETRLNLDSHKNIWVSHGSDLYIYGSKSEKIDEVSKLAEISLDAFIRKDIITDFEFLSDSELIVVTATKMVKVNFDWENNYAAEIVEISFDSNIKEITKIIKANNSIWIGTNDGLYHTFYENNQLTTISVYFNSKNEKPNQGFEILSLYVDKQQKIWIGTKQNGIIKYDVEKANFTSFKYDPKYKNGITSNRINCFYEDPFGILWIGTAQGGLNKFDKNQNPFQNYSHNPYDDESLSSNLITDITEDNQGRIWFSFFESTICRTKERLDLTSGNQIHFERLEKQLGTLKKQWVLRLYQDFKGYWWVSTYEGLYMYDEKNDRLKKVQLKVNGEFVSTIFPRVIDQINNSQIILGGTEVLILESPWANILNDEPVEIDNPLFDLSEGKQVNDYIKDNYGNYWFVATKGVYRLVNRNGVWSLKNSFTTTPDKDGLRLITNRVFSIHKSNDNNIWLGTFGGGLMKIELSSTGKPIKTKSYHRKDGLRDEVLYGILEDNDGKFWMSTDMGISCFDPLNERFHFYDVSDGVLSNNFRQSAFLKTKNGKILMGGVDGLTIFDPNEIIKNEITPKILISRLKINNQPIVTQKKFNNKVILNQSISDTKNLVLDYENRNVSLDVIVQHSAAPKKNKLAYKLEGVNTDWIEIDGGKTTATYTNLSSGTYDFLYKGSNGDAVWTEETKKLTIQILAPWYARWWSISLWVLLGIGFAYTIFNYLVRLDKLNHKLKFEQLEKERVYEMNQAKLRFFTNISHDFKTPLSLIIGPLEKIAESYKDSGNQKYFSIIKGNILRLNRLIDQLISYRKAETGHLKVAYSKTTLGDFIYPLIEAFEDYSQTVLLNFYYKVDDPNKEILIDIDKTERVLLNLFSNAVKYVDANREVSIEAGFFGKEEKESLYIKVTNTGVDISATEKEKIFNRFYRAVEDKNDSGGTGIGLALCKSLIDLMNGTISVSNIIKNRTTFRINLPIQGNGINSNSVDINKNQKISMDWLPSELDITDKKSIDLKHPTILVVDDEKDVRSFLYEAFKHNYNVELAIDGEDGLEKLNKTHPQLIISDVMMPKVNGYELCEKVKSSTEFCHIPVILLTADDDRGKKLTGLESGADDYIVKPFSIKYLEVKVKKLIENKQRVFDYFSRNSFLPKDSLISSDRDKEFLEKINISIEENMSNSSFGVEELAGKINMSTSHFYRRLKELTGQAPSLYLRNFRLQKAAEMLSANKNLTAADVMFEIGIESKSYYSSSFKKIHGISPSEFVKQND